MSTTVTNGITVDDSKFVQALNHYVAVTSKTAKEAVDGKMRDIFFMSCKNTPIMPAGKKARSYEAVAVHRIKKQLGIKSLLGMKKPFPFTTPELEIKKNSVRRPARGYMKSCFAKAGFLFRNTPASKVSAPSMTSMKHKGTSVNELQFPTDLMAEAKAKLHWMAKGGPDAEGKQSIATDAFRKGLNVVYYDMINYLAEKQKKLAAEISAK